jgi:hypothetical protein
MRTVLAIAFAIVLTPAHAYDAKTKRDLKAVEQLRRCPPQQ